jgi:hypothetical protein
MTMGKAKKGGKRPAQSKKKPVQKKAAKKPKSKKS